MKGQLNLTFIDGIVSGSAIEGATLSEAANWLLEAIKNPNIKIRLDTLYGFYFYDPNKNDMSFLKVMHLEAALIAKEKL